MVVKKNNQNAKFEALQQILKFDPQGFKAFSDSLSDVFASFYLVFVALPVEMLILYIKFDPALFNGVTYQRLLLPISLSFIMHHCVFYLVMAKLCLKRNLWFSFMKYIQIRNAFITFFICVNLMIVSFSYGFGLEESTSLGIIFFLSIYSLMVQWFYSRQVLKASIGFAIGIILLDGFIALMFQGLAFVISTVNSVSS